MRPTIFLTRHMPEPVERRLGADYEMTVNPHGRTLTAAELAEVMGAYDGVCPNPAQPLDAAAFAAASRVRIVANYGVGFEHIDLEAARRAGVAVTNTPDAVTDPTADLAVMLMLMATRRAGEGERLVRAGAWAGWKPSDLLGASLAGKLLGLVGFGRIGQATAARARAFGLRIAYHSRRRGPPEAEAATGAHYYASLDELAAEADILSLHCPGGAETRHLVDAALLARMKPTAVLVNSARGSVVDEGALAEALAAGHIAAAGLDVFEREPHVPEALLALENVVLLPHMGSATVEARIRMGMEMADNLDAFFAGKPPPNPVV